MNRKIQNFMADNNYYLSIHRDPIVTFQLFDSITLEFALEWWSSLSVSQYVMLFSKPENLKWKDKGRSGIIHIYLNEHKVCN